MRLRSPIIALAFCCLFSASAVADHPSRCFADYHWVNHLEDVTMAYVDGGRTNGQGRCIVNSPWSGPWTNPYYVGISSTLSRTTKFRNDLNAAIVAEIRDAALDAIQDQNAGALISLRSVSGSVSTPIQISLAGPVNSSGNVNATVTFGIKGYVRLRVIANVFLRAQVRAEAPHVVFAATYNVNTGELINVTKVFPPDDQDLFTTAVETWGLGSRLNEAKWIMRFKRVTNILIQSGRVPAVLRASLRSPGGNFLGLGSAIPIGEFVVSGQDHGAVVRNQLNFTNNGPMVITQSGTTLDDAYLKITYQSSVVALGQKLFPNLYCPTCNQLY